MGEGAGGDKPEAAKRGWSVLETRYPLVTP
jgi:hypothetical protein